MGRNTIKKITHTLTHRSQRDVYCHASFGSAMPACCMKWHTEAASSQFHLVQCQQNSGLEFITLWVNVWLIYMYHSVQLRCLLSCVWSGSSTFASMWCSRSWTSIKWKYSKYKHLKVVICEVNELSCILLIFECVDFSTSSVFLPVDFLRNLFSSTLGLGSPDKVLDELTLEGVAQYIKSGKCESSPDSILLTHYFWL